MTLPRSVSTAALRAALRLGGAVQALPPRPAAVVRRASALRLTADERAAEARIDALRTTLAGSTDTVEVVDYGAGTRGGARPPARAVADVYRRAATGPAWGRFLFGLARALRPARVLELGTNLGVGSAHLAAALALNEAERGGVAGRLVTLEGAPALAARAERALADLGHADRARVVVGPFADTLADVARAERWDLVFIDGHHEAAAALNYVRTLAPHLAPGALVVLDDVEPGRPVRRAWRALRAGRVPALRGAAAFYAGRYGLLFAAPPARLVGATPASEDGGSLGRGGVPWGAPAALARETAAAPPDPAGATPDSRA
ncbi:class I SAM-dependent methyltransferase [Rubrivirga sp. S365]|uniref:O-methyltransferase n=1 Tax=Rubrivirga sp. S365 TaxID=3076080 RepID=UPI0028CA8B11|nr:class I SAM-dependent methyltransferase [Rubrivirga sp. S365]MDT7855082.1 class I SAM-dependent methyltransferase [Rubrivirga sp. S365]